MTAFTAFLNAFRQPVSVLAVVAGAFPRGATFFVSWSLLIIGLQVSQVRMQHNFSLSLYLREQTDVFVARVQHGLEIALFGISWINHNS